MPRLLRALAGAALLAAAAGLDLSSRQLTDVAVSDGGAAFAFRSASGPVAAATAAELARETELVLRGNALETVPAALFRSLKSAKRVDLSNNPKLTRLQPNSFVDLPELVEITCINTSLAALPAVVAANCPKLETLMFNASFIRSIQPNTFSNLSALHTLVLSDNNLTSVPGELFSVAKSWELLDFTRNSINGAPPMISKAVVAGYISFEQNLFFEIKEGEFANAAHIQELRLGHNGIDTVNSNAFDGMKALRKLDLSDNVISIIGVDAFKGLESLQELLLGDNYLKRLKLESIPPKLERLELQSNFMDLLPDLSSNEVTLQAPYLRILNLSHNAIWALETNSELAPYPGLVQLDLGWNRIENFTAAVLKPIQNTIELINLDYNQIESVPSTTFLELLNNSRTTISLRENPGIGTDPTILGRVTCPNGSVYDTAVTHSENKPDVRLYGCIQCRIGTYHDVKVGRCIRCVGRAFADKDGATACQYCPYSSDLDEQLQVCLKFVCNGFCWMTILIGFGIPFVLFGSKVLLYTISTSIAKQQKLNLAEQEQMTTWRMEQMLRQLGSAVPLNPAEQDDEHANNATLGPCRIYDLPKETQETVLETLQEHFQLRKQKLLAPPSEEDEDMDTPASASSSGSDLLHGNEWDDVEWSTFHMHRILSRNYNGEVFLGDYCGAQVVVKRLMTLRFQVRELADAISDVELMLSFRHPQITRFLGTMWNEKEHLCIISEYVKGGDLHSLLELEAMNHTTGNMPLFSSALHISTSDTESFNTHLMTSADSASLMMQCWSTKLRMMLDVCKGLAHAHDAGISHGDLRSRNVLVTEAFQCKLNDFSHYTRCSDKYATTALRLQSEASDDEENEDDSDVDAIDPKGVHLMEFAGGDSAVRSTKKSSFFASHRNYTLPLLPPEVLHHATRHLGSDIYSCGILLIELWFYRFVSRATITPPLQDEAVGGGGDTLLDTSAKLSAVESNSDAQVRATSEASSGLMLSGMEMTSSLLSLDRSKAHNGMVQQFIARLRGCAYLDSEEPNDRSFGTTTTSSTASISFMSTAMMTEKLFTAVEECLHFDPKKRPTAKMLVKLFQQLLDDSSPRSH